MNKCFNELTRLLMGVLLLTVGIGMVSAAKKEKVTIVYAGNSVKVSQPKNKNIQIQHNGAKVVVESTVTDQEVEYVLKGSSANGSFELNGAYKATVTLDGVVLTTQEGAAINLKCGKRIKLHLQKGSSNSLVDGVDTLHKACVYTKGHLEIDGEGNLTLTANSKNAIAAKEYVEIKSNTGKIAISSATGNGISSGANLTIDGGMIDINLSSVDKKALKCDSTLTINGGSIHASLTGDGGKGVKCDGDMVINGGSIDIETSGNYVSERAFGFGDFGGFGGFGDGEMPDFGGGMPDFGGFGGFPGMGAMPDSINFGGFPGGGFPGFGEGGMPDFGGFGGFPGMGAMPDSINFGGFPGGGFPGFGEGGMPDFGGGMPDFGGFGGFGGQGRGSDIQISDSIRQLLFGNEREERGMGFAKRKYNGSAKAIKVMGTLTINGGDVKVKTASTGAEGMEAKRGVTINGGTVYVKAMDDGISSNGTITFNGGDVFVWSVGNDAIDSNSNSRESLIITGGKVTACSQVGPPEEPFDSDFSQMTLTGGTVFGMGGSMMGEAPMPKESADTQLTVSLNGLPCPVGKTLLCVDDKGKELYSFVIPFSMQSSSSILSLPQFEKGKTYKVKIKEPDVTLKEFTF
ncbi:MAG: carbohydrate-binding domain-containing protein [Bacteroidaceae bacterium]|nr:carbohydrate-binding domain-containing protein [Bacteroidaceae bacterium]